MKVRQQPGGTRLDAAGFDLDAMHQGAGAATESSALELSDTDIENLLLLEPKGYCRHCHEKEMDKRTESLLETLQDALSVSSSSNFTVV